jgi:hypothetical protein
MFAGRQLQCVLCSKWSQLNVEITIEFFIVVHHCTILLLVALMLITTLQVVASVV